MADASSLSLSGQAFERVSAFLAARSDRVIDTGIARIFLGPDVAWKIKKPVSLGYLDYSTQEKRIWAIRRELEMNRAGAPDIYRGVRYLDVGRPGAVDWCLSAGEPVLEMRRFDPDGVLSCQPERLDGGLAETLGRLICDAQNRSAVRPAGGGFASLDYVARSNAALLRGFGARLDPAKVETLIGATDQALAAHRDLLDSRAGQGLARRCHADLHLGNILLEDGKLVLFDCIEFNEVLTDIDVLYDVAFTLMDLGFRGRAEAASRLMNGWLDQASRHEGWEQAAWTGLAALPVCLSLRAGVRCHVEAAAGNLPVAGAYLDAALGHLQPAPVSLTAIGGLSGSGKSTHARRLAPGLGGFPGAVVLRSDEIRKRLWQVAPTERLPPQAYAAAESARVYAAMYEEALHCLKGGRAVVLDAAFLTPQERQHARMLAEQAGVTFGGFWMEADPPTRLARVAARRNDASDAGQAVLEQQLLLELGEIDWIRSRA